MHELAVATGIAGIVLNVMKEHGKCRVLTITLVIGAATCVDERALRSALDPAFKGTAAQGAEIRIERPSLMAKCRCCEFEFSVDAFDRKCPSCGELKVDIISGRELHVKSIEAE